MATKYRKTKREISLSIKKEENYKSNITDKINLD